MTCSVGSEIKYDSKEWWDELRRIRQGRDAKEMRGKEGRR
jgi:hypothetical protein